MLRGKSVLLLRNSSYVIISKFNKKAKKEWKQNERGEQKKKVRIKILLETYAVAFFVEGPIMYVLVLLVEIVRKIHFQNFFLSVCQKTRRRHAHGKQVYSVLCPSIDACLTTHVMSIDYYAHITFYTISLSLSRFPINCKQMFEFTHGGYNLVGKFLLTNFCSFYLLLLHFYYYIIGFYVF